MHERHIGPSQEEIDHMLGFLGYKSLDDLMHAALPNGVQSPPDIKIPSHDELTCLTQLAAFAKMNRIKTSMLGQGFYNCITPAVIRRNILENPSWYTSYTPYQPEISQGRLEMLINFQTMICDLTGLEIANASMLDEASCAAEAMLLAKRVSRSSSNKYLVHNGVFPHIRRVLETRADAVGVEIVDLPEGQSIDFDHFGVYAQYQSASGKLLDLRPLFSRSKRAGAICVIGCDLLMLTLFTSPGELGADIAFGSAQRFGIPMNFGGPLASFLAARKAMERSLPGRLVGVSVDADSNYAYRLTLQTREQHIRREKATSNICTATVLMAIAAVAFAQHHGPKGLRAIAHRINTVAVGFARLLKQTAFRVSSLDIFDTIEINNPTQVCVEAESKYDLLFWKVDDNKLRITFDEVTARLDGDLPERLSKVFGISPDKIRDLGCNYDSCDCSFYGDLQQAREGLSSVASRNISVHSDLARHPLRRFSGYLKHPVFNNYTGEVALMRYLKALSDKDFALDRGMIPLGSCTMKLNAAFQLEPVLWPEFANLHPFAPLGDADGTLQIIDQIETWLANLSGYDAVSLQPTAGSQGELAGLLAIRGYYKSLNLDRDVCLIPASAHGTNAASAVLAGMRVVVVACDQQGNIDLDDLRLKASKNAHALAALMVTYPSTHGVYEDNISEVCSVVHKYGGQVYVDGANSNALIGYLRTGDFGGDVSHLNLHKTFGIPHGGGGPGIGPVVAKAHLAPFLPFRNRVHKPSTDLPAVKHMGGPIASSDYGFAGALYISWAYIFCLGSQGMKRCTAVAVLVANYIAKQLSDTFPVLYTGKNNLVAHEFIMDFREVTRVSGITVDDVCKRLIDYGFHAPTMSFPVPGTLMVEPTESEPFSEIQRFIKTIRSIRAEIDRVIDKTYDPDNNPLKRAPHTLEQIASDKWDRPYSRRTGIVYTSGKYWPASARIDNAYGDRNIFCTCPDLPD
ncbi:aminomethyl-transferring glycine dehydrogenase [Tropheryma whipplei]|uniref:aminomethyl-transferring glycine dehydrogenase n=1 Tax=Tropheryma whipplei TaxID=2039 RepID=UPI0005AB0B1A|nr:aminomethyl-transferring glycine dehydrogenase [Tropheryma whipplei]